MANRTLADEIIAIIRDEANNNPAPTIGVVTKIYTDDYVDVTTDTGDYRYIKIIGDKVIGNEGILVFIDGELDNQYFLSSTEVPHITIDDSLSNTSTNPVQNKIITTALTDKVDKETGKGLFSGKYNDLTDVPSTFPPSTHNQNTTTITNTTAFDNILAGETSTLTLTDQDKINTAINNVVGDLKSIKFIVITDNKGTASADTMGKLYIVNENSKVNVYYTKYDGSSYSWEKMDTDILDELVVSWNDVQNKPNFSTVATSGSYSDLSNKPSIPSKTSDLNNDSNFISTSNTSGLIKNDGSIDATQYSTFSGSYTDLTNKPSIPSDVSELTDTHNTAFTPKSHNHTKSDITDFPTLSTVATSGSYNDLSNKPTIPAQNVWYGTSSTGATAETKAVTVTGWEFTTGNILFVKFTNANTYNGTAILKIGDVSTNIVSVGTTTTSRYYWKAGELVGFVYDGTNFTMLEKAPATTTYYGITKLSDSVSSTSTSLSATPNAVRQAYELANGKADAIHTHIVADVTDFPTIPSKISDLTNDSNFIETSSTSGLIKNDGTIDTTSYSTFSGNYNDLTNKPSIPSDLSDLTDNNNIIPVDVSDLTDDYNTQFTPKTHTHSEYVNPTIADNLTTNDSTQVLSAKQGKVLNDLIGNAITYINQ